MCFERLKDKRTPRLVSCHGFIGLTTANRGLFMKNEDIFEDVLSVVSDVTGVERADIRANRNEVSTDARYILVRYLSRLMSCATIGVLLGRTRQGVRSILSRDKGDTWLVETNWKEVVKRLSSKYFICK